MIPVVKPYIPNIQKYFKYIKEVNDREWLTNFGPLSIELTLRLEDFLGVKNLVLVSNGTLALQIAYRALGIKGKVLTTPFSFVATSSALAWEGINPQYVDINKKNLALDPDLLSKPDKLTTAVQAVHVYGNPAPTIELEKYCKKNKLRMIYDGAHAFGVSTKGKSILASGDASTLSFHATKVFHTIEGGAVIFKSKDHASYAKQLINFGYDEKKNINAVGINSKLNEYQAAVGLVLLDEIEYIIEKRVGILANYHKHLDEHVEFPIWEKSSTQNGSYAPVILKNEKVLLNVMNGLQASGIQTRRYFHPSLNTVPGLGQNGKCPVSEDIASRILCLPMYTSLNKSDQLKVVKEFKKQLKNA